jgi:hypothetical protein
MAVLATWISVTRMSWLWQRLDWRSAARSAAVFAAIASALAVASAEILTRLDAPLVRTSGLIVATCVLVWAGHWLVSQSSANAYLLVLWLVPGIAVTTSQPGKERVIPLSRLVKPSDNRVVRWVDLAPWVAAAVGACVHRRGARR